MLLKGGIHIKNAMSPLILGLALLVSSGCTAKDNNEEIASDTESLQETIAELEETVNAQSFEIETLANEVEKKDTTIDTLSQDFSFLDELNLEEITSYELFLETNDVTHLNDFSPEKIMLLYFHAVIDSDLDTVYSLTYDNGSLPDVEEFKDQLQGQDVGYLITGKNELLMFRDYNFVEAREEGRTNDYVSVEINGSYGTYSYSTIYGLMRDQDVWKMDTLN